MKKITAQDLFRFQLISGIRISPDGKSIVFSQQRTNKKTLKKYSNLWLVNSDGQNLRQFTCGDQTDIQPVWSPDGKTIAFLSNRQNKDFPPRIFLIPLNGGEAQPLTDFKGSIKSLNWTPDGNSLICSARKLDPEEIERLEDEQKKNLGIVCRHYDRLFYKLDGEGFLPHERWHLWKFDIKTGKGTQLTDHPVWDDLDPAVSPDGKTIAFISNRTPDPDFEHTADSLYTLPIKGGEATLITGMKGNKSLPCFSPDGRWIALYGVDGDEDYSKNMGLLLISADGKGLLKNLTEPLDQQVACGAIGDMGGAELHPPLWTADSQRIIYPVKKHGASGLHSIGIDGKNPKTIFEPKGITGSWSLDQKQEKLACYLGTMTDPGQVMVLDMHTGQSRILSQVNAWLATVNLSPIEEVWYKGADNNDLQGWIMTPPDFDPHTKYPALLYIHGGPAQQYGYQFMHEFFYLTAHGYVVVFTNPRGGKGYGYRHFKDNEGNWGSVDYQDLMVFTDLAEKLPYVDRENMGVLGGSYGGFMTLWIIGHTHRFKAANAQRSVFNMVSEWGSSDFNHSFEQAMLTDVTQDGFDKLWDRSPMKYIHNAKTPTLIIHNENDHRCPVEQSEQAFTCLKRNGVEAEFLRFPGEFHGLSRNGRTDRRIVRLEYILKWFDKHLKN